MDNQKSEKNMMNIYQTIKVVDGKYQIKNKKLGEGSFAVAHLAIDAKNGEELACKMISKKGILDRINASRDKTLTKQYFINALKNEVRTWKTLEHPNIVKFKDFSETQNNIYFFLEFCEKGHLESLLQKNGSFKQKEAIPIFLQLAQGCEYLYGRGIFHRDIKTENILLSNNGTLKISDFGFAKMIIDEEMKDNPSDGTCVDEGTPIYMSPQILSSQKYTIKCDVWSLGVVFYKVLFNLFPWPKTQNLSNLFQRMKQELQFPPKTQISQYIKDLIRMMIKFEQEERLSIKDVVRMLKKIQESSMDIE